MNEKLNLPSPSSTIINYILNLSAITNDIGNYKTSKSYPTKICAGCFYQRQPALDYLVRKEFQNLFDEDFVVQLLRFRNFSENGSSVYPPHTDVGKLLNLNYVIDTGGDNVKTIFYNKEEDGHDKLLGQVEHYENLTPVNHFVAHANEWHAVDVKRFHSLDNIVGTRTILCLGFKSISFNDFKSKYSKLICHD